VVFQWLKNGDKIPNATGDTYVVSGPGIYQVMSFNSNNCTSDLSDPVNVIIQSPQAGNVLADMSILLTSTISSMNLDNPYLYTIMVKNNGPSTGKNGR
jgi:hypothetical protein